jgi:hypothetical protein
MATCLQHLMTACLHSYDHMVCALAMCHVVRCDGLWYFSNFTVLSFVPGRVLHQSSLRVSSACVCHDCDHSTPRRAMLRACNHRALHADVLLCPDRHPDGASRIGRLLPALNKFWIPDRVGVASLFPVAEMLPHYRGVEPPKEPTGMQCNPRKMTPRVEKGIHWDWDCDALMSRCAC